MLQNKTENFFIFIVFAMLSIIFLLFLILLVGVKEARADDVASYQVPTFSDDVADYHAIHAPNPIKTVNSDLIVKTINACYPVAPMNLDVSLKVGTNYRPTSSATIQTADSASYYAGVVASMPLYSGVEIDKEQKMAIDRKEKTANLVASMLTALSTKTRAERMLTLYASLEKRSQKRVADGIVAVDEQIGFLEKVATTRGELDTANATIEGARLALIHQCTDNDIERLNNFILSEIF